MDPHCIRSSELNRYERVADAVILRCLPARWQTSLDPTDDSYIPLAPFFTQAPVQQVVERHRHEICLTSTHPGLAIRALEFRQWEPSYDRAILPCDRSGVTQRSGNPLPYSPPLCSETPSLASLGKLGA